MQTSNRPEWLTLDAVARYPRPGTVVPSSFAFSPDSRLLTFLFSERGDLIRELWAYDIERGERWVLARAPGGGTTDENVNPEEALRRERQRLREGGITHYAWGKSADRILVPINGRLYITDSRGGELRLVVESEQPAVDARLTPDGSRIVFVRGGELWVVDVESGDPQQLTFTAMETCYNGLAEFIAQEEMGRSAGFWISPDGSHVAYTEVDEGHIPVYPIVHQGTEEWRVEEHRYPFAGAANAHVRLGVMPIHGGDTVWMDLGQDPDFYLARVDWSPTGRLFVQYETRAQDRLELRSYDPATGSFELLLTEETYPWVNLHNDLRFVGETGEFIWTSERDGYRNVYLYRADGTVVRPLTEGVWPVDSVVHVDDEDRGVYFLSGRGDPLVRHLFRVSVDSGAIKQITTEPGFHNASFASNGKHFVHTFESVDQPPAVQLTRDFGEPFEETVEIHPAADVEAVAPDLCRPQLVTLKADDGATLQGAIYEQEGTPHPAPVIVSVYGGPHAQMVNNTWGATIDLRAQYLATQGFVVFKLDNRGAARRGLAFEGALHLRMGKVEVQDQVAGVRWLVERGIADPERVGIYGWSYGGYMTLMCLLTAPDTFKAGVAGAPVADWDGYDTHYTERYMGTPESNPDGYREGSALTYAANLIGDLLIVHGMVDENVHFRHAARMMAALETAGRRFEVLIFPEERHMPRGEEGRRYLEDRVVEFFRKSL